MYNAFFKDFFSENIFTRPYLALAFILMVPIDSFYFFLSVRDDTAWSASHSF